MVLFEGVIDEFIINNDEGILNIWIVIFGDINIFFVNGFLNNIGLGLNILDISV